MVNHPHRSKQQQAKHTPGPWYQTGDTIREEASDAVICTVSDGGHVTKRVIPQATAEANARLIAAAPETAAERDRLKALNAELLTALKEMVHRVDHNARVHAFAAIAKAEGR